jgi:hypothetical protein
MLIDEEESLHLRTKIDKFENKVDKVEKRLCAHIKVFNSFKDESSARGIRISNRVDNIYDHLIGGKATTQTTKQKSKHFFTSLVLSFVSFCVAAYAVFR